MKLPRDLSGQDLAKALERYGYRVSRQTGSHMRLSLNREGESHRITIPDHAELRVGTLNAVLRAVSSHLGISRENLTRELFGG